MNVDAPKTTEMQTSMIVRCCLVHREGDPTMITDVGDGKLVVNLKGYMIVPAEDYAKYTVKAIEISVKAGKVDFSVWQAAYDALSKDEKDRYPAHPFW
jgi:hypothetical protein